MQGIETYVCPGCGRVRPDCDKADDDYPDLCDRCWAIKHVPLHFRWFYYIFPTLVGDHDCDAHKTKTGSKYKVTIANKGYHYAKD